MTQIFKFPIYGAGYVNTIKCHKKRILDIQLQGDNIVCWIETAGYLPEVEVKIISYGTGWDIPEEFCYNISYIKTIQDTDGYVWHFYEVFKD